LQDETFESFAEKILGAGSGLSSQPSSEIISKDMKTYKSGGYKFAISQAEVSDLYELNKYKDELQTALSEFREGRDFDFSVLMVTDVVRGNSRIMMDNPPAILGDLP